VSYYFTASWHSGELAGSKTDGYLTFDSSSIAPGQRVESVSLLTDFWMELRGYTYTEADVTSASATFRSNGSLSQIAFGTRCELQYPAQTGQPAPLGTCSASSSDRWNFYLQYDASLPFAGGAIGDSDATGFSRATTRISPREVVDVPEPGSVFLSLLALGLPTTQRRARGNDLRHTQA